MTVPLLPSLVKEKENSNENRERGGRIKHVTSNERGKEEEEEKKDEDEKEERKGNEDDKKCKLNQVMSSFALSSPSSSSSHFSPSCVCLHDNHWTSCMTSSNEIITGRKETEKSLNVLEAGQELTEKEKANVLSSKIVTLNDGDGDGSGKSYCCRESGNHSKDVVTGSATGKDGTTFTFIPVLTAKVVIIESDDHEEEQEREQEHEERKQITVQTGKKEDQMINFPPFTIQKMDNQLQ